MIMGFAARVVPTLNGADPSKLSSLRGPFLLVNLGCLLRVTMQIATDWTHSAYAPIGLSGTMEVAGLAWWGFGLIAVIQRGRGMELAAIRASAPRPDRIQAEHRVADVLDWFPGTLPVFLRHGFTALENRVPRRTLARQVTVGQAAALRRVEPRELLDDLNAVADPRSRALPVLSRDEIPS